MANTFSQIHLHFVFSTQFRAAIIANEWRERLHQYMTTIIQARQHKMMIINSMPDHLHMLVGVRPNEAPSKLIEIVKRDTTAWVNKNRLSRSRFAWQDGFSVFSVGRDDLGRVVGYIKNQQIHHRKLSFEEEYVLFLKMAGLDFNERFVFDRR